jgi:hypothetical protein
MNSSLGSLYEKCRVKPKATVSTGIKGLRYVRWSLVKHVAEDFTKCKDQAWIYTPRRYHEKK